MFFNRNLLFTTSILTSTLLFANTVIATDLTVPLTGSYENNIIGWSNTTPTYDNVNINFSGKSKAGLTGTNVGHTKNLNTNVTGGFIKNKSSLVALQRGGGATITENNIINISGGQIGYGVFSTSDQVGYNETDRRALNQINFSGGTIGNRIEGGAGAEQNNILVTGGMLKDSFVGEEFCEIDLGRSIPGGSSCGTGTVGTIYAGVQDANTVNLSKNALVTLKDMDNSNTFLSTFVQGSGNEGLILGSNVTGTSEIKFDGVDGDFQGGFKDFDKVSISNESSNHQSTNVTLTGNTYNADTWDINGTLDTNGKTLSTYKNSMLALNVGNTGSLTSQFISDTSVLANNFGSINGIKSLDNDITINNNQQMTGDYEGNNVIINNETSGVIYGNTNLISSDMSLSSLNNSGNITGNLGLTGNFSINNQAGGIVNNLTIENNQLELIFSNNGTVSGDNVFNNSISNIIKLTNSSTTDLSGSLTLNNGTMYIQNDYNSTIKDYTINTNTGRLNIANNGLITGENIVNADGLYADVSFSNYYNGVISGKITNKGNLFNLANSNYGIVKDLNIVSEKGEVNILNVAKIEGNNTIDGQGDSVISITNWFGGNITGTLNILGGVNSFQNISSITNLALNNSQDNLAIKNMGNISGNNEFNNNDSSDSIIINNSSGFYSDLPSLGTITGNLKSSDGKFVINNEYQWDMQNGIYDLNYTNLGSVAEINNYGMIGGNNIFNTSNGGTLVFNNDSRGLVADSLTVSGHTTINNNGTILATLSDSVSPSVGDSACPTNTLELNNSGNISGDMSVMNNTFKLNNIAGGNITSNHIDSRDLRLTNAGRFDSDISYLFSVRDYMEVENTGLIYGRDMAFKLIGKPIDGKDVKGYINNSGTIFSQGTTIGYDGTDIDCPTCYGTGPLVINNSGSIVAVDFATLTNPNLDSHAIFAENAVVNNSGLIGGSMHVKNYNQKAGATWVTFLDKDLSKMSTILAEDKINIESGSILTIHTNNDVRAFKNGQKFELVNVVKKENNGGMSTDEIEAQIKNFTLKTDSPFANYQMDSIGQGGYIEFNHVAPTKFADATDLATASHNTTILGSQRMYELFVNRDVNQVQGLASGDSFNTSNKFNFMPIGGYAHQGDKDNHAGYDTNYYGGMGYFEHDFDNNFKGGLGFAYMNNSTDFNDADESDGKIDSYRPFAYINYENGPWRVDLAGGVAKHKVDNNRKYSFNDVRYNAQGKYDADEISGHLNVGYKIMLDNNMVVQPIVGAYTAKLKTDSFEEKGSGPMNMHVESEDYNSFKSMLGVKLKKDYAFDNGTMFTPELHIRWYHELGDTKGGVSAFFLAQEQLFNTSGIESPKDVGDIALRLTTKTGTNLDLFTEAYYQFGNKFYNAGGTVGLQYNF